MSYFILSTYLVEYLTYMSRSNVCRLRNRIYVNEILSASYIPHIRKHPCDHTPCRSSNKVLRKCILLFYILRSYSILTEVMVLVVQMASTIYKTLWFYIRLLASSHKNAYIRFTAIKFYKNMQNRKRRNYSLWWSFKQC